MILVGTEPISNQRDVAQAQVASYISSIVLLRVSGDNQEGAQINEFKTEKKLYQNSDINFLIQFKNISQTHFYPRGYITIYDIWGRERERLIVNEQRNTKLLMANATNDYNVIWSGRKSLSDAGRYTAVLTMDGWPDESVKKQKIIHFWILPTSKLFIIISFLIALGVFLIKKRQKSIQNRGVDNS